MTICSRTLVRPYARTLLLCGCAAVRPCPLVAQEARWQVARPDYRWQFPRDHWAHPDYKTEWWYFTGQLVDVADSTRRFGYQFTFFRVGVLSAAPDTGSDWATQMLVMGHAAITDFAEGRHHFSEVLYRAVPLLGGFGAPGDSLLAWSRAPAGTSGHWTLRWSDTAFAFAMADSRVQMGLSLVARPERPVVLQGPGGLSRKNASGTSASLYYSFTRLATTGTVNLGGRTWQVRGRSWMDKEFGSNQLSREQVGWDWFSLQLDDGRDLMLYLLRDSTGATSFSGGTLVPGSGEARYLGPGDFTVRRTGEWTSQASGAEYPSGWQIEIPGESLRLEVSPIIRDQENRSQILRRLFYWEGAVGVQDSRGRLMGQGYVELVGYGQGLRPAF